MGLIIGMIFLLNQYDIRILEYGLCVNNLYKTDIAS